MIEQVITEPAKDDLRDIWRYIAENSYLEYADGQLDRILVECELLTHQPEMGVERAGVFKGIRFFPIGRYNIYYRYQANTIFIAHVVDSARDFKLIS
jgi:toxin ParE1/3/4